MNLLEMTPQGHDQMLQTNFFAKHVTAKAQKTVLLAEDNDDLRLLMECCLATMGYLVVSCADAYRATEAFHAHMIDVLVTDYDMPGKTGLELARELTILQPFLPVMVITGSLLSTEMMQELQDRRWIYMSKPSNLAVVESVLKKLVAVDHPLAA